MADADDPVLLTLATPDPGGPVLTVRLTPLQVEAVRCRAEADRAGVPFAFAPAQLGPPDTGGTPCTTTTPTRSAPPPSGRGST